MKLISHTVMRPAIITIFNKSGPNVYPAISLTYAHKDGGPVLKGTPRIWSYWNGIYLAYKRHRLIVQFRRFG